MTEQQFYVYTHARPNTNDVHGIFYVGKGNSRRIGSALRNNKGHKNFVNKYGKKNIIVRKLACESERHALDLEVQMIAKLREIGVDLVNNTDGGEGISGYKFSEETKKKLREIRLNQSDETKRKISEAIKRRGIVISEEGRKRITESNTGRFYSMETRKKIGESSKGRKHSEDSRKKLSNSHKNSEKARLHLAEICEKNKGRKKSEEARKKISEANKGKVFSEETKKKMSEAAKRRCANAKNRDNNGRFVNVTK